jgi:hypothetical protein
MYCPNCGKTNSADQNFCRSCGLQLEKVMQSLVEQLSADELNRTLSEKRRKLDKLIQAIAVSTASILVFSVMGGIIYSVIVNQEGFLVGGIFLALILGLVLFGVLMLYRESMIKASNKRRVEHPEMPGHDTAKLLSESQIEPIPSVTDRTTDLLELSKRKRNST